MARTSRLFSIFVAFTVGACGGDGSDAVHAAADAVGDAGAETTGVDPATVAWCEGATVQAYDPLAGIALETFPDDLLTRDDPESPTGLRVDTSMLQPWIDGLNELVQEATADVSVLTGFGTNAGVLLRFSAPIDIAPPDPAASTTIDELAFWDLGADPPERVPYELILSEEGRVLILWPLRPLKAGRRHAVVLTRDAAAADGGCAQPSDTMKALLTRSSTEPALQRVQGRYAELLERTGLEPGDISAATVFTTHDDVQTLRAVAHDVRGGEFAWEAPFDCEAQEHFRRCSGALEAWDYRDDRHIATPTPKAPWTLNVTLWLPLEGDAPAPVVLYGHGINDSVASGAALAERLCPRGYAVIATNAMEHGDHPVVDPENTALNALKFLGIDLQRFRIDPLRLRGNFNQTAVDRLQLIEAIKAAPDVDGDGADDLDPSQLAYYGISLGGMMGPPLLALSDDIGAAVLMVAGGRLITFATDNDRVEPFKPTLLNIIGSEALFDQLLVVAQAVVDPADPATFAAQVLRDRFTEGSTPPHVLMTVALKDETVPPASGRALARALGAPHVEPELEAVGVIPTQPAPVSANVDGGAATAGYFQIDRVSAGDGVEAANHGNTPYSPEGFAQALRFLESWRAGEAPEIIDPFAELGTGPLPAD